MKESENSAVSKKNATETSAVKRKAVEASAESVSSTTKSAKAGGDYITIKVPQIALTTPVAIIVAAVILAVGIGGGLYFGLKAQGAKTGTAVGTGTVDPALAGEQFPETVIRVRDRAVLGDLNKAKVVIVELTDFMCVFCRQFATGINVQTGQKTETATYESIQTNYINNGQVAFVYKNLPLSIHEPAATETALRAECVRQIGGFSAYKIFHDQVFAQLDKLQKSGASGLDFDVTVMNSIIAQAGVDVGRVNSCAQNKETQNVVAEDVQDVTELQGNLAAWLQANGMGGIGTPGFVIGKLQSDGTVKGKFIGGAYPFSAFQTIIEEYLAQ
ncbi:MAG: thioredoxin domain-containing protein [Candidatus Dojkabacteria bacterium]|nr:MAG: thioredoxin domain-containing protein [Candidatus Dojkabacteria bacterium]